MNNVRQVGSPYAYISLREVRGRIPLEFRLVSLDSNEVLFRAARIEVACDDPLRTVELVLPVPLLPKSRATMPSNCSTRTSSSGRIGYWSRKSNSRAEIARRGPADGLGSQSGHRGQALSPKILERSASLLAPEILNR